MKLKVSLKITLNIKRLKKICGELTYLIPGIGSQGGDIGEVINSLGKINLSLKLKNIQLCPQPCRCCYQIGHYCCHGFWIDCCQTPWNTGVIVDCLKGNIHVRFKNK